MENILHLKAPGDWINDPNGFIYYKGKYHLFYQYFPCAPVWGTMHWGHAVSDDLVSWKHLGIALFPTKSYDRNGVFSGSAFEIDGQMKLYYTAVRYLKENMQNINSIVDGFCEQSQAMICSKDGFTFDNFNGKSQIIPPVTDIEIGHPYECRDPKVWEENGQYYMCLASTYKKETGVLLIYTSCDGEHWTYLNRLQDRQFGAILECPDIFEVDGQHILVASPIGILKNTKYPENQSTMQKILFDADNGSIKLESESFFFDYGMDLYAPQSCLDEQGRRCIIAWARMPIPQAADDNEASNGRVWSGMMCLPRVVTLRDGEIFTSVHPNVRKYFSDGKCEMNEAGYTKRSKDRRNMVEAELSEGECIEIAGVRIELKDGFVCTDRSKRVPGDAALHTVCRTPFVGGKCNVEIYLENNLIEIFVDDGRYVISNVLYKAADYEIM